MTTLGETIFTHLRAQHPRAGIAKVAHAGDLVSIWVMKPFVLIGRGERAEAFERELQARFGAELQVELVEIRRPELFAVIGADHVAGSITRGTPAERIVELQVEVVTRAGALGCRVEVTGDVAHRAERGTIDEATAESFEVDGVIEPPLEADADGYPIERPPPPGPLPAFRVRVTISRPD